MDGLEMRRMAKNEAEVDRTRLVLKQQSLGAFSERDWVTVMDWKRW